jgi:hypothetical protein
LQETAARSRQIVRAEALPLGHTGNLVDLPELSVDSDVILKAYHVVVFAATLYST